ncbi:outer membrane protein assembly factor BamA [Arcobacter sp. FWKO B]|uniref:outer membrane protein assembly factor BamA n=1 Tax=Arcobacter sp. FWKO B TaxID=2593672 RepID=UPI0018A486DE|nr:outer membrane protein assembly factor BamA [Arcobacter sp. FWKO B]QOG11180.1 outer membrane protein assembly factor BamA [Arcobacter sp. FWKO B]
MNKTSKILLPFILASSVSATQIKEIKFENLARVSEKIAFETIDFKVGDNIDITKIDNTLKKFFQFGYFDDILVYEDNGVVTLSFKEKPSIAKIDITGYKTRDDDKKVLYTMMGIKKGSIYSKQRVEKAKKALLEELEREGYLGSVVEIDIKPINEYSLALEFQVNKGDSIILHEVNYQGAQNIKRSAFEDVTANKQKESFSWFFGRNDGKLRIDHLDYEHHRIRDLYFQKGYLDAEVKSPFLKVDFNSNHGKLDFFIDEGIQYSVNSITIYLDASILDPQTLYKDLKLQEDKTFNIERLRSDVEFIKTSVADLGYAYADVDYDLRKNTEEKTVDVVFSVVPHQKVYINDVYISGNTRTLDRVIRRDVFLAPKDLFNYTDYKDSINALKRTGHFEDVNIEQIRVSEDKMDLLVKVTEAPTGQLILGGGYGSYDGFMLNAAVNDSNIFGSGKDLGFSTEWSRRRFDLELSLYNPAIFDSQYSGLASVYRREREIINNEEDSKRQINGIVFGAGKKLTRNLRVGSNLKYETTKEKYKNTPSLDLDYKTVSVIPYLNYNSTDDYFLPRKGMELYSSVEVAGLAGDAEFIKNQNTFKYFYGFDDKFDYDAIFRYKARLNYLNDLGFLPRGETFYLGGLESVRGYESYAFGPGLYDKPYDMMFSNNLEMTFPLFPKAKMRWGVFYDYGMIGRGTLTDIKRAGTGAFLEWNSPVGPLQFIFAQPIGDKPGDKTSSFEFSLGSRF